MTNKEKLQQYIKENLVPDRVADLGTHHFYFSEELNVGWAEGHENFSAAKLAIKQAKELIEYGEFKKAKEILSFQDTPCPEDTEKIRKLISIAKQGIENPDQSILKAKDKEEEFTGREFSLKENLDVIKYLTKLLKKYIRNYNIEDYKMNLMLLKWIVNEEL